MFSAIFLFFKNGSGAYPQGPARWRGGRSSESLCVLRLGPVSRTGTLFLCRHATVGAVGRAKALRPDAFEPELSAWRNTTSPGSSMCSLSTRSVLARCMSLASAALRRSMGWCRRSSPRRASPCSKARGSCMRPAPKATRALDCALDLLDDSR